MRNIVVLIVCVSVLGCSQPEVGKPAPAERPIPADLVVRGGPVITMDTGLGIAGAVAVRAHEIVAVGSSAELETYIGPATALIELAGRALVPGFIEGHGHFLSLGRAQQVLDLSQAQSFSDIVSQVARAVDGVEPGAWIFGKCH